MWGDSYNQGSVLLLGSWSQAALAVFLLGAVIVLVMTWLDLRDLRRSRGGTLLLLRGLVLATALALVTEPALELKHVTKVKNHVVILVDASASSRLPSAGEVSRWDVTRDMLEEIEEWIARPSDDHVYDVVAFGDDLTPTPIDALGDENYEPSESGTEIGEALESLSETYGRQELGGVLILSDGIDTSSLAGRTMRGEELDAQTVALVEELNVPIHTFATAEPGNLRDVAIESVRYDDFAFVRNAVAVEVDLTVLGYDDGFLQVTLRREGEVLATRRIPIERGEPSYSVEFEFVPELLGKEIYDVQVSALDGEALLSNNREFFVLKVIRDRIRVLQVVGRPGWDVRFLRQLLKENPNVDLISFFILRTQEDITRAPNSELSLIPFPVDELFDEELGSFDLVIFQNFTFEPYGMRQYLDNVRDFVEGGGGFAMVGGEQSFSSGGYAGTEIEDLLPVRLPPGRNPDELIDLAPFRPALTDAGARHPITRLEFEPAENRRLWQSLPPMRGTNRVLEPVEGATVLATHPTQRVGDEGMPTITVGSFGEGRTLAMTFDGSWRWSFDFVGEGGTSRPYTSFWNSAIRWLIRDPELNLVQVEIPREIYAPGETMSALVRVFEPDYSPAVEVAGTLTLSRRPLDSLADPGAGEVIEEIPFETDGEGRFRFEWPVEDDGAYRLSATADVDAGSEVRDDEIFLGIERTPEYRDIEPRPELLEAISEASGGTHRVLDVGRLNRLDLEPARVEQVDRRKVVELWNHPLVLLWLAGLLAMEWILRRRWGRL